MYNSGWLKHPELQSGVQFLIFFGSNQHQTAVNYIFLFLFLLLIKGSSTHKNIPISHTISFHFILRNMLKSELTPEAKFLLLALVLVLVAAFS